MKNTGTKENPERPKPEKKKQNTINDGQSVVDMILPYPSSPGNTVFQQGCLERAALFLRVDNLRKVVSLFKAICSFNAFQKQLSPLYLLFNACSIQTIFELLLKQIFKLSTIYFSTGSFIKFFAQLPLLSCCNHQFCNRGTLNSFQLTDAGLQSIPKQDHTDNIYSCFSAHNITVIKSADIFQRI